MIILALDQSITRSGFAVLETGRRPGTGQVMHSGWFGSAGGDDRVKVDAFIQHVRELILDYAPGLMVWEKPAKYLARVGAKGGVNAHQLVLTRLDENLFGLARDYGRAFATVAPNTWRAKVLGKGAGRMPRDEAKRRALAHCAWIGQPVKNADQAEAICIGLWALAYVREDAA